jgi:ketopantoate reductase
MLKSIEISHAIIEAMNTPEGQAAVKPLFEEAYKAGKIKTQADFNKLKDDLALMIMMMVPEFKEAMCEDVYSAINAKKAQ